jgi:ribosomal protein S18 acetylase RimI-like enzyme
MVIREMRMPDHGECCELWSGTPGVRLTDADTEEAIGAFLCRNPGMSFVAEEGNEIIGTSMCGHDGRRGYIYHVAVKPEYRGKRLGTRLVEACMERLRAEGINKCHVFVLADNALGNSFWASFFKKRADIALYSRDIAL